MRRMQRPVLLRVTLLRLRGPSLLLRHPVLPSKLATQGAARSEMKGGEKRSATVVQSRSLRFLNFSSSRMRRLRHNIYIYRQPMEKHVNNPWPIARQRAPQQSKTLLESKINYQSEPRV
jgi:hypothetical protein